MLNAEEQRILGSLNYGIREIIPMLNDEISRSNVLKAIEIDHEYQLGVFDKKEVEAIVSDVKEQYIEHNKKVKKMIKSNDR